MLKNVDESNFIAIQGWMRTILNLKGTDLLIYAIIFGFSQKEGHWFNGSLQYLSDWTGVSKQSCITSLKKLVDKGFILKEEFYENGIKYCRYSKNFNGIKKTLIPGIQKTLINNIDIINNNINNDFNLKIKTEENINNDINNIKEKKLTKKQKAEKDKLEYKEKLNSIINDFSSNENIRILINDYIEMRETTYKHILTPAQLKLLLLEFKKICGDNIIEQERQLKNSIMNSYKQMAYPNNFYQSSIKSSYSSVDNTANHILGNYKITDEELDKMTFEEKKHYIGKMAIADMTDKQKEFFKQYCLAKDEKGNLLKF